MFAAKSEVLERAREHAALTVPSVVIDIGSTINDPMLQSYQNIGSDGVSNLRSHLLTALFPPIPWFRFVPSAKVRTNVLIDDEMFAMFENWLYARELLVASQVDAHNHRVKQAVAIGHQLIVGDSLVRLMKDYRLKNYPVENWAQKKDSSGDVIKIMTVEDLAPEMMTQEEMARARITDENIASATTVDVTKPKPKEFKLYTRVIKSLEGGVNIVQELNGTVITESHEKVSSFFPVGFEEIPGQDYSRSFVEMKMGDLRSLNGLSKAILDGSVAAAKLLVVIDETKGMYRNDIVQENGAIVEGRVTNGVPDGIGFLQTNKMGDFQVASATAMNIEKRLAKSMLIESSMQPTGERVTATQIMRIARELQSVLGGIFAPLARDMQEPYLKRLVHQMEVDLMIPSLPPELEEDTIQINLLTGMEALSRQTDLESLINAVQTLSQIPGALDRIKPGVLTDRILQGFSLDPEGLRMDEEEFLQQQAAQQQAAMEQQAGQQAIQSAGKIAEQQVAAASQQEQQPAA